DRGEDGAVRWIGGDCGRRHVRSRVRGGVPDLLRLRQRGQRHVLRAARLYPHNRRRDVLVAVGGGARGLPLPVGKSRQDRQGRVLPDAGGLRALRGRRPRHHSRRPGRRRRGDARGPGRDHPPARATSVYAGIGDLRYSPLPQGYAPQAGRVARRGGTGGALRAVHDGLPAGDRPHHGSCDLDGSRMGPPRLRPSPAARIFQESARRRGGRPGPAGAPGSV
ncbi:MAG: hypothetical protein AVDCRST_MAG22-2900, partial [uncultured Rubrobacteraceae bacterium]